MPKPFPSHRRSSATACCVLAAFVVALLAAAGPAAASPRLVVGMEQNGGMDNAVTRVSQLDEMRGLGMGSLRFVLRFDQIARCDPYSSGVPATSPANPCYDFTVPDAVVLGATERDMQVLLSVYGAPAFAFHGDFNFTGNSDAEFRRFRDQLADFTQAAATRYDGLHAIPRVARWTIWNEPNGGYFWAPRFIDGQMVVAARYAQLYDASARRIKAVDPTMQVALGPTAPTPADLKPIDFVRQMLPVLQQLGSPVDAYAHNAYMGIHSPLRPKTRAPAVGLGNINDLIRELDRFTITAKRPIWITEFGYMTAPAAQVTVTPERQAELLADSLYYSWRHRRIDMFIWYALTDDAHDSGFKTGVFYSPGRCGSQRCPKPAAATFPHPVWVSSLQPLVGDVVTVWAQGRIAPARARLFISSGTGWKPYTSARTATTGVITRRVKVRRETWFTVCDASCGPVVKVVPIEASKIARRIAGVTLPLDKALARGVRFKVRCGGCDVTTTGTMEHGVPGLRRATLVARGRIARRGDINITTLRFTALARARLSRAGNARVLVRTRIENSDGKLFVWDRTLTLS